MMIRIRLTANNSRIRELQRQLDEYPDVLDREVPRAINRTTENTRKDVATRLSADISGITKDDVIRATKTKDARSRNWSGHVELSTRCVPVGKLNMRLGTTSDVFDIATPKQSAWLFYNVFRKQYGDNAIYSRAYQIVRKVHQNITYRVSGRTRSLAGTGAFPISIGAGKTRIFKRIGALRNIKERLVEMRGPSLFQILDENTAMLRKITEENTRGFERELEKISIRHPLFISRQPLRLISRVPIDLSELGVG